jgi:hypothetical protein
MLQTIDQAVTTAYSQDLSHHTLEGQVGNTPLLAIQQHYPLGRHLAARAPL